MNFVFISPNFPTNYWKFCKELKNNGVNVLGIGDCPYDDLSEELKGSLNEYYKVGSMENYDEVYRAVAFFTFKHGRIDWIESNNEYWLERDAKLRTDFNVKGLNNDTIDGIKYKSKMKEYYAKAGVKTARYHLVTNMEEGLAFKITETVRKGLVAKGKVSKEEAVLITQQSNISFIPLASDKMVDSVPTKLFESLGIGTPVLLVGNGESVEILNKTKFGISILPSNISTLSSAFDSIINSYSRIIEHKEEAIEYICKHYSRQKYCEDALNTLCGKQEYTEEK